MASLTGIVEVDLLALIDVVTRRAGIWSISSASRRNSWNETSPSFRLRPSLSRTTETSCASKAGSYFDRIAYRGPISQGRIALEVSNREAVVEPPDRAHVGEPFYDAFEVPVMAVNEIVAEKLRTLCQRRRATDLSDDYANTVLTIAPDGPRRCGGTGGCPRADRVSRAVTRSTREDRGADRCTRIQKDIRPHVSGRSSIGVDIAPSPLHRRQRPTARHEYRCA